MRLAILHDDCSAVIRTDVEQHAFGTAHTIVVAVDAMILPVVVFAVVLIDRHLLESRKVALVDAQLAIELVTRLDESVAEESIDGFLCDADFIGFEVYPSIGTLCIDIDGNVTPLVSDKECAPFCRIHLHDTIFFGSSEKLLSTALQPAGVCCGNRVAHYEVERCDVWGYNNICVVGIDLDRCIHFCKLARHFGFGFAANNDK